MSDYVTWNTTHQASGELWECPILSVVVSVGLGVSGIWDPESG